MTQCDARAGSLIHVIDRIIPADQDPGAIDLGTEKVVVHLLGSACADPSAIEAGLNTLTAESQQRIGRTFTDLTDWEKDALLEKRQDEPWFAWLCEATAAGFYADPANGGNHGGQSWTMVGYIHGLPEGPSGPPRVTSHWEGLTADGYTEAR